jgi:hypothetical protein
LSFTLGRVLSALFSRPSASSWLYGGGPAREASSDWLLSLFTPQMVRGSAGWSGDRSVAAQSQPQKVRGSAHELSRPPDLIHPQAHGVGPVLSFPASLLIPLPFPSFSLGGCLGWKFESLLTGVVGVASKLSLFLAELKRRKVILFGYPPAPRGSRTHLPDGPALGAAKKRGSGMREYRRLPG